ncbi:hypothetical protein DH2020_008355 [Rehmannia glutinosa]|uniref:Uncharacterized protein n=1 Tax=Rehmannia glutinosa TaxID=99300 RepID=A0ABR0U1B6_REHGL
MVSPIDGEKLIRDIKLSTVVPACITGEDKAHEFTDMDLAMKLHYITTVHFFGGDAAEGLSIQDLKTPMFQWLQHYYPICGRIRRRDGDCGGGGRPFVKCNDSGVRIVEAKCDKTVAEWLAVVGGGDRHRLLVYHQRLLARDFGFTPLVFLQLTKFKCGGLSVGMRWAHVLGDAFSASECINTWGKIMANPKAPRQFLDAPNVIHRFDTSSPPSFCRSVKLLDPLGDNWLTPNNFKMQMHTFHITEKQINNMLSGQNKNKYNKVKPFELISAIVWKSMAKIRGNNNNKIITVCKKRDFDHASLEFELSGNTHQAIGIVEAPTTSLIVESAFLEIAKMIGEKFVDETNMIAKRMEGENGNADFLVYGSNLTFVDLEEVNLWGLKLKGKGPVFADLSIGGVGDEGAVVVVRNGGGKIVNVILPDDQLEHLKNELRVESKQHHFPSMTGVQIMVYP